MTLIVLLLVSNLGAIGAVTFGHFADNMIDDYVGGSTTTLDLSLLTKYFDWESFMVCLRDVCLNEAVWFFSFRYWAISFAMQWKLKQIEMPRTFKILAFSIFLIFVLLNIIFPVLYAYYGFLLNTAIDSESKEEAEKIDQEYHT